MQRSNLKMQNYGIAQAMDSFKGYMSAANSNILIFDFCILIFLEDFGFPLVKALLSLMRFLFSYQVVIY